MRTVSWPGNERIVSWRNAAGPSSSRAAATSFARVKTSIFPRRFFAPEVIERAGSKPWPVMKCGKERRGAGAGSPDGPVAGRPAAPGVRSVPAGGAAGFFKTMSPACASAPGGRIAPATSARTRRSRRSTVLEAGAERELGDALEAFARAVAAGLRNARQVELERLVVDDEAVGRVR